MEATLRDQLEMARRHVADGKNTIQRQRKVVADLDHSGHDCTLARALLQQFEKALALHIEDRDRLERKLAEESN